MKIDCWECDECGARFNNGTGLTAKFKVGSESADVGDQRLPIYKVADLCISCVYIFLSELLAALPLERQAVLAQTWKARYPDQ